MKRGNLLLTAPPHKLRGNDVEDPRRAKALVCRESQLGCGWRATNETAGNTLEEDLDRYKDYGMLQSMMAGEKTRRNTLEVDGKIQMTYTKSNDGWVPTLISWRGRALDRIYWPWGLLTLNAFAWTLFVELYLGEYETQSNSGWESFFSTILNTSLAFLLVFRLNRAAERFWLARQNWGVIVGVGRHFASGVLVHGRHNPRKRDEAIKWVAAFSIATKQFMRSIHEIDALSLAGILEKEDVIALQNAPHPPLYASCKIRSALQELFYISAETPPGLALFYSQQLQTLEGSLNIMMDNEGAMERIKSTPLPLVYVTHLRTFLVLFLALLPYIWAGMWGWPTVPIVFVTSFAFLGLEGASEEVECPFRKDRPNHLNMDAYCLVLLMNIQQILKQTADSEIEKRRLSGSERITKSMATAVEETAVKP